MLREETQKIGALLLFDEVMTSRLAPGGVQGLRHIDPDLTTLGKFWGGGFTFGAFGGRRALMQHLDLQMGGKLSQGGTLRETAAFLSGMIAALRIQEAVSR